MNLLESNTLTGQDIHEATCVLTHVVESSGKMFVRLFADSILGDGEYTAYITIQLDGSGPEYHFVPMSNASVEAGVTSMMMISSPFPVLVGDVVKVYLTGLAGDTADPDILTEIWSDDTALASVWTNEKAAYLDTAISSRVAESVWTDEKAGYLDAAISSRTDETVWTDEKAGYLDAAISSRATDAAGSGPYNWDVTVTSGGVPMYQVLVWCTVDEEGLTEAVASGRTNSAGFVRLWLDAGTYYLWYRYDGYTFGDQPETIEVG